MSSILEQLSQATAGLVEQASPSVVQVNARRRLPASGIIWSVDGLIVTANHIVERDDEIAIGLPDGALLDAELVGRDPSTDLALLRVATSELTAAHWEDARNLHVGHIVLALGRPGRTAQATLGVISALGGEWKGAGGGQFDHYLQTDVAMYPGFSGGPLMLASGAIAGLNSSALVRGVSVAIPAATVRRVVDTLLAHGRVPRGYLGVGIQPLRLGEELAKDLGQDTALMIMSVEPHSPAANAGLLQGDILAKLGSVVLRQVDDLQALLASEAAGREIEADIVRAGSIQQFTVTVGKQS
jgi:S1-C subfamily serine protease